jgi:hypothetical protein
MHKNNLPRHKNNLPMHKNNLEVINMELLIFYFIYFIVSLWSPMVRIYIYLISVYFKRLFLCRIYIGYPIGERKKMKKNKMKKKIP